MDGLAEGRMVHYVLPADSAHRGEHRAAVVVKVWDKGRGYVNLMVLTDGTNDGALWANAPIWRTSVLYSAEAQQDTWHWPEQT